VTDGYNAHVFNYSVSNETQHDKCDSIGYSLLIQYLPEPENPMG